MFVSYFYWLINNSIFDKFRNDKVNIEFGNNNNNKKYIRIIITKPKGKKVECEVFA